MQVDVTFLMKSRINQVLDQKFVQGKGDLVKLEHFDKHFVKNTRKKSPSRKNLEFLSQILLNYISNEKLNS